MLVRSLYRGLFSTVKVSIESIKKLREETSAPMGECRKALEESESNHQKAILWLKQKGLATSEKRAQKETREGVIASFVTPCRRKALLLEVNCETDFVAKSDLFLKFVNGLGASFLHKDEPINVEEEADQAKTTFNQILEATEPANIFPEDPTMKSLGEEMKLVISRLQENVRIRRAITFHTDYCRYGTYVHRPYTDGVGLQACIVQLYNDPEIEGEEAEEAVHEFADDMATQISGCPPKYLNFDQIPQDEIEAETEKVKVEVASILAKAPEHTHEKIISGKLLSNFYSKVLLGCMPYILSNQGAQVSEYWSRVEHQAHTNISILRAVAWECK